MSEQKNRRERDLSLDDFANALKKLSELKKKYNDINEMLTNGDQPQIKTDNSIQGDKQKKLYQYLTYLFVGGLAGEVNVATGNMRPYPKGLNLRLKDMHVEEFKRLLDQPAFGNIINETGVSGNIMKINGKNRIIRACATPSNVLNNAYIEVMKLWKNKDEDLNTKLNKFVDLYNISKKQIKEVGHDAQKWYRWNAKRPFVNLWRMCKRAYQAQDFSYACDKYKNVFNLLDTSKKENEIQK
ncbi:MAG: hypothetical protein IJT14_01100 [Rickettsiales bacterium]|nr:hypothetical protein [Rickettsiales bacterium]